MRIQSSDAVLTDNSYTNNFWAAVSMDLASNPLIAGVEVDKNAINGLYVDGGTLGKDLAWNDPDIVYWLGGDILVPDSHTLTVSAGQVIKFGGYHFDLFIAGTLDAQGTAAAPIVFTESRDDTKNDTNNDGTATTPNWDQWGRIEFLGSSRNSVLDFVQIRYGGYSSVGMVQIKSGDGVALSHASVVQFTKRGPGRPGRRQFDRRKQPYCRQRGARYRHCLRGHRGRHE